MKISYKLSILVSFLGRYDQCALSMKARIIEFLSFDQILLVKLKNVLIHWANLKLHRLQF